MTADDVDQAIDLARLALADARKLVAVGMPRLAAREAYYVMVHSASALLIHHEGRAPKTHNGLRSRFGALVVSMDWPGQLGRDLAAAYEYKQTSDYGPIIEVPADLADSLIVKATAFLELALAKTERC